MKALVFHDVGDTRLDDVEAPTIQEPTDAIIRLTSSAICGTDPHMIWVSTEAHPLFAGQKRLSTPANRGLVCCSALPKTQAEPSFSYLSDSFSRKVGE